LKALTDLLMGEILGEFPAEVHEYDPA